MKSIVLSVLLVLFVTSYVRSEDIEESEDEKRWGRPKRCKSHDECPGNAYCSSWFKRCKSLPRCRWWDSCSKIPGATCDKKTKYCLRDDVRYCNAATQCDSSTECCSRRGSGPSYCKKLPGVGETCCDRSRDPCRTCSPGLKCVRQRHSLYGKCQVIPTTTPPTTEQGSGEMDESLAFSG